MGGGDEDDHEDVIQAQKKLREFIRNYREGNIYPYREQLQQRWRKRETFLEVNFAHLQEYNHDLMSKIAERTVRRSDSARWRMAVKRRCLGS